MKNYVMHKCKLYYNEIGMPRQKKVIVNKRLY